MDNACKKLGTGNIAVLNSFWGKSACSLKNENFYLLL